MSVALQDLSLAVNSCSADSSRFLPHPFSIALDWGSDILLIVLCSLGQAGAVLSMLVIRV